MVEKAKANVKKKTWIRDGQRNITKTLLDQVKQRLSNGSGVSDRQWGKESLQALQEQVDVLKKLDNQILDLIGWRFRVQGSGCSNRKRNRGKRLLQRRAETSCIATGEGSEPKHAFGPSDYRSLVSNQELTASESHG